MRGNVMTVVVALLCVSSLVLAAPLLQPDLGSVTESSAGEQGGDALGDALAAAGEDEFDSAEPESDSPSADDPFAGDEYDDADRERFADDSDPIDEETTGGPSGEVGELRYGAVQTLYWRTASYDRYTGDGWERTRGQTAYAPPHEFDGPAERQRFDVTAETPIRIVPAPYQPVAVDAGGAGGADVVVRDDGAFELTDRIAADTSMTVTSDVPEWSYAELKAASGDYDPAKIERYGTPRSETPARVTERTDRITADQSTPYGTAVAIEHWLKNERAYSLDVPPPEGDVVDEFLHEMDAGYCEYFASAMTEMLRTQGIPARYVTGYSRAPVDGNGVEEVTADRAHAWVEVYFEDVGWVTFDPTPPERDEVRLDDTERTGVSDAFEPQIDHAQHDTDEDWEVVDADVELLSEPIPGTDGTVRVTDAGAPLVDHRVSYNGDVVGATDENGEVTGTLPYARSLTVTVERYTAPGDPDEEEIEDETDTDDADEGDADEADADDEETDEDGEDGSIEGGDGQNGDDGEGTEGTNGDASNDDEAGESTEDEDGGAEDGEGDGTADEDGGAEDGEGDGTADGDGEGDGTADGDGEGDGTADGDGTGDGEGDGDDSNTIGSTDPFDEQPVGGSVDELPDDPVFSVHHDPSDVRSTVAADTGHAPTDRVFASGASLGGLAGSFPAANADGIPLNTDIDIALDDEEPLHPGSTVTLTATIRENPVPDATVGIGNETYTTDENGTVDIDVPYADSASIEVTRESATGTRDVAVATDVSVAFTADPVPGSEATVEATIDDRPVEGLRLLIDDAAITRTDANGTATVPIGYAESVRIVASRDAVSGATTAELPTEIDVDTGWFVVPGGSATLTATIDGVPVSNATVTAPETADTETDSNGTAVLSVPLRPQAALAYTVERGAVTDDGTLGLLRSWLAIAFAAVGLGGVIVRRVNLRARGRQVAGGAARLGASLVTLPRRVVTRLVRLAVWGRDAFARGGRGVLDSLRALAADLLTAVRRAVAAVPRLLTAITGTGTRLLDRLRWLCVGPRTWIARLRSDTGRVGDASGDGPGAGANATTQTSGDAEPTAPQVPPRAIVLRAWRWLLGTVSPGSTMTPAEIADSATALGFPERYVRRILDAFRSLRYGHRSPSPEDAEAVADAERSLRSATEGDE